MEQLRKEIENLREENAKLRSQLSESKVNNESLSLTEYQRYGRQMIVEESGGLRGQLELKSTRIVVVGAGGLGCPSLQYLVGAGVGHIGIVDNDTVEASNLHRQTLHDTSRVGTLKCESAKQKLNLLNPFVDIKTYPVRLTSENAFEIFDGYNYVLDCTDSPATRYLVNDVAVSLGITVISASGVGTEGQLCILNFKNQGPCYRCFYPTPPPPNSVSSCSEGGVIGPCIGLVGVMMAIETLKLIYGVYTIENFKPFLMSYSGFPQQSLRVFKMRGKQTTCKCCGSDPKITKETIESGEINYTEFCGQRNYNVCSADERITVKQYHSEYIESLEKDHILIDVRPSHHYDISHFQHSINIPLKELKNMHGSLDKLKERIPQLQENTNLVVLCRFGNDSQLATRIFKDEFKIKSVKDVKGGFFKYIDNINQDIPKY
ncbi:hypothetical protein TPHA_0H01730 [Tetrapisispora phaffii CBS 4417]|uniref:Needs CLA4 to survive protein 3 n=1 Tax=Tetrapisispora phaffii (strain ATCC 24235 / CBS 4417 / NBRC 1672 / NRRL Y-8282 / UCD 70-5) TaxID=1071381 RepID=G8BX75_TETPH|nr:hypothetical protein TPHA_0H01730 [Tetrapisispora phaffii CBS 4417]CCE64379.1 hypothetical protein TPHA_0H01730 [Tetrapisispora phaffii CBS 4417]